jgi:PAS domain S-box-containing protein
MAVFDMKTVIFANVIVNFVGMVVMSMLWYQNHDKYSGIAYWLLDWILLTGGMVLISLQGSIPPWESMILSNSMIVGGTMALYFGLRLFAGKKNSPLLISAALVVFAAFIVIHTYFTVIDNNLIARSDNAAVGLLLVCLLAMWLLFKEVSPQIRRISTGTGIAFGVIALICVGRILGFSLLPQAGNQFLTSGKFDTTMVILLVGAIAFLVFNLVLMVTRRLYIETEEMGDIVSRNAKELQAVFRTTSVGFGIMADRVFKEVNEAYCRITGYSREELLGKEVRMLYPTEQEYLAVGQMYPQISEVGAITTEIRLVRKDRVMINAILNIAAFDKNDLSGGIIFSILDITARKQAEEALRQSEEKYRLIVENTLDVIFTTDEQEKYLYVSPSVKNMLGYSPAEFIGKPFVSFIHPDDISVLKAEINNTYAAGYKFSSEIEYRLRHASGVWRWVVSRGTRVVDTNGKFLYFIGIIKDITERKQVEAALKQSEQNLRNSMDSSAVGIYIVNKYVNKAFMDIFGYKDMEEVKANPPHEHYTPESLAGYVRRGAQLSRGETTPDSFEVDIIRKDGGQRHLQVSINEVFWDGERRRQVFYHDITERKQAEEALKDSEARFHELYENSPMGLYRTTPDGHILMANPALIEMLGYSDFAELSNRNLDKGVFEPSYPRKQFIENIENQGVIQGYEYTWKRKDGTSIQVRENARAIRDTVGNVLYFDGTVENITERKQAEAKTMASLAEKEALLKEVHHRVKNNMQVISSLLHLQERKVKDKESAALLKDSQNRIQSMALVYNKLYRSENLAGIDMTEYINELALGLVKSYAVSPSRITVQVAPGKVFLDVDLAIPCGMVVNELVTNSLKYAFPDNRKGLIFISLKEEVNHTLELVVSDNGVGIPENFNPDNTTTLGIKLVSNLVCDQLGGKMELNRSPGTTFRITFRRAKEEK